MVRLRLVLEDHPLEVEPESGLRNGEVADLAALVKIVRRLR